MSTLSTDVLRIFIKEDNALGLWHVRNVEAEVLAGELVILPLAEDILVPIDIIVHHNTGLSQPINQELIGYITRELNKPSKIFPSA